MKFEYLVSFGGGIGPNVWDNEIVIEADNIREALEKSEPKVNEAGGWIYAIEQRD